MVFVAAVICYIGAKPAGRHKPMRGGEGGKFYLDQDKGRQGTAEYVKLELGATWQGAGVAGFFHPPPLGEGPKFVKLLLA
jgi:hypothetical protein